MSVETEQEVAVSTRSRPEQELAASAKPFAGIAEMHPSQLFSPVREVERFFDRLMPQAWMRPLNLDWPDWGGLEESFRNVRAPKLDVIDRDKEFLVRAELPGVDRKNVDVSVNDNVLIIKAGVCRESEKKDEGYYRREIARSDFSRSLALPEGVDAAKISASLKNGMLEIVLPKEAAVQRRAVEVK